MPHEPAWERFFDAHAPIYNDNVFTKNTLNEVEIMVVARKGP